MRCIFGHKWETVAIDTSLSWHYVRDPDRSFDHILLYQVCKHCGERQMDYDDPTEDGIKYAKEQSTLVAKIRSKWVRAGIIPDRDRIEYVDPSYAPMRGFEKIVGQLKRDPEFKDLLKNKMIDDALGQLEVAVKLHVNNQPKVETE